MFEKIVFFGIDISSLPSLNYSSYATSYQTEATGSNIKFGFVAGVNAPVVSLRLWAGYSFIDNLTVSSSVNTNTINVSSNTGSGSISYTNVTANTLYYGSSLKFGASYTIMKNLAVNGEYAHVSYSNLSVLGIKNSSLTVNNVTDNASDYSSNIFTLSVSAPFNFAFL